MLFNVPKSDLLITGRITSWKERASEQHRKNAQQRNVAVFKFHCVHNDVAERGLTFMVVCLSPSKEKKTALTKTRFALFFFWGFLLSPPLCLPLSLMISRHIREEIKRQISLLSTTQHDNHRPHNVSVSIFCC